MRPEGKIKPQSWVVGKVSVHALYFGGYVSFGLTVEFVGWRCRLYAVFGSWINTVVTTENAVQSFRHDSGW